MIRVKKYVLLIVLSIVFILIISKVTTINGNSSKDKNEVRAIFVSYIELNKYVGNSNGDLRKKNIDLMIKNIKDLGFNTIILQIRSFSDAIYKSNIFPWSSTVSGKEGVDPGFDVLEYFIEQCKANNMYIYGWINPYRVRSSGRDISEVNPAYKYLGTDYLYEDVGVYYNPSKREIEDLIVDGVLEVVSNYQVDGILFDDYFYPSYDLDYNDYVNYLKDHDNISFDEYHLMIINRMISRVHEVCFKHNVIFGVSPDGNIENNYGVISADVKAWLSSKEYVDFIMPQVYYGFFNETKAFLHVIEEWDSLIKNDDIKLNVALAFYKVGVFDKYARSGSNEWINNSNIIMREIILSRNLKYYNGFSLFRYDFLFDDSLYTNTTMLEIENMRKILN